MRQCDNSVLCPLTIIPSFFDLTSNKQGINAVNFSLFPCAKKRFI